MALKVPITLVSQTDINRLLQELDGLNRFFADFTARRPGAPVKSPRVSLMLEQLARDNEINLLEVAHRQKLKAELEQALKTSPVVLINFATEPTPRILDEVLGWLRTNIHPQMLLQVGVRSTIIAGCILRTRNRIFDMSLRLKLQQQEDLMVQLIHGGVGRSQVGTPNRL